MFLRRDKLSVPTADEALPGRPQSAFSVPERHVVLGTPLEPPFPDGLEQAVFAMGCFWGAERKFWETEGVYTTAVGYRSEEHTSELQSLRHLVCRLLLEKKNQSRDEREQLPTVANVPG